MSAGPSFSCPQCATSFPYNAALLGKRVKCPACQHVFVVQGSPDEPTLPAADEPQASSADSANGVSINIEENPVAAAYGSARRRGVNASQLLWALLDFRLEKYLTPHIIRLYWMMAIVVALLYVLGIVFALVLEGPASITQASDPSQEALRQLFGQPSPSIERSELLVTYNRFKSFAIRTILIVSFVLAIRVWCELIIVMFNIANSLKSIENRVEQLSVRRE